MMISTLFAIWILAPFPVAEQSKAINEPPIETRAFTVTSGRMVPYFELQRRCRDWVTLQPDGTLIIHRCAIETGVVKRIVIESRSTHAVEIEWRDLEPKP